MISLQATGTPTPIYLPVQTAAELQPALDRWYDRAWQTEQDPEVAGADDFPVPDPADRPKPRVGVWYFPTFGLRRYARGDFLIGKAELEQLRLQLSYSNAVDLTFADGGADVVYKAYLLQTRPLVENNDPDPSVDDLWVITLVDKRYYWQFAQGISGAPGSWTDLFSQVGTKLGATVVIDDSPAAAYLTPTATRWSAALTTGVQTVHLADSAAHAIGSRIVVDPDGTPRLQRPTAAHKTAVTDFHAAQVSDDRHHGGGLIPVTDLRNAVPQKVATVLSGSPPIVVEVTLGSLTLADYAGATGAGNGSAWLWADAADTITAPQKTALSEQVARDYYLWQLVPLEAQYAGFVTGPSSGFVDHVEHWHTADEGATRVCRPPVNYGAVSRGRAFAAGTTDGLLLVEITGGAAGGYTAKRKTWSGTAIVDYSPLTTYTGLINTMVFPGTKLPVGTVGYMTPIPDVAGKRWFTPNAQAATEQKPGLLSSEQQQIGGSKTIWGRNPIMRIDRDSCAAVGEPFGNPGFGVYGNYFGSGVEFPANPTYVMTVDRVGNWWGGTTLGPNGERTGTVSKFNYNGHGRFVGAVSVGSSQTPVVSSGNPADVEISIEMGAVRFPLQVANPYNLPPQQLGVELLSTINFEKTTPNPYVQNRYYSWIGHAIKPPTDLSTTTYLLASQNFCALYNFSVLTGNQPGQLPALVRVDGINGAIFDGRWNYFAGGILYRQGEAAGGGRAAAEQAPRKGVDPGPTTLIGSEPFYTDGSSRVTLFLSPLSAPGDRFEVIGRGTGGWEIAQRAGMQIRGFDATDTLKATTVGTGGAIRGPQYSTVVIECVDAGTTFVVVRREGPITWI